MDEQVDLPGKVKAEVQEGEDEALPRGVQAGGHLDTARLDQGVAQLRKPLQHTLTKDLDVEITHWLIICSHRQILYTGINPLSVDETYKSAEKLLFLHANHARKVNRINVKLSEYTVGHQYTNENILFLQFSTGCASIPSGNDGTVDHSCESCIRVLFGFLGVISSRPLFASKIFTSPETV